jgi:hypothetical protein
MNWDALGAIGEIIGAIAVRQGAERVIAHRARSYLAGGFGISTGVRRL